MPGTTSRVHTAMFGYATASRRCGGAPGSRYRKAAERAWRGLLAQRRGRGTDGLTLASARGPASANDVTTPARSSAASFAGLSSSSPAR